jgi:hypothetical protein
MIGTFAAFAWSIASRVCGITPVVGCHHQHDDVGHLGAAGPHQGKRFVAGRVEEDDVLVVDRDVIRADVLCDAARFALGDPRFTDGIEQTGLAVVDVAHDGHDRCTRDDVFGARFAAVDLQQFLFETAQLNIGAKFARDHRRRFGVERAVDGQHDPLHQQLRENVLDANVQLVRQILDRHALGQRNRAADRRRCHGWWWRERTRCLLAALALVPDAIAGAGPAERRSLRHSGPLRIWQARPWRTARLLRANRLRG